jgi:hypothetical protein
VQHILAGIVAINNITANNHIIAGNRISCFFDIITIYGNIKSGNNLIADKEVIATNTIKKDVSTNDTTSSASFENVVEKPVKAAKAFKYEKVITFKDVTKNYNIPIIYNFPAGHISDNRALLFGNTVTLEVTDTESHVIFE